MKNIEKLLEEFKNETWSKPYTDIDEMFRDLGLNIPKGEKMIGEKPYKIKFHYSIPCTTYDVVKAERDGSNLYSKALKRWDDYNNKRDNELMLDWIEVME